MKMLSLVPEHFLQTGSRALVVGEFPGVVDALRSRYVDAYGMGRVCHPFFYDCDRPDDVHMPTDYFDVVLCAAPQRCKSVEMMRQLFRIVKPTNGHVLIGSNVALPFAAAGFSVVPMKSLLDLVKPAQARPKIMVAPGIGDVFWVMAIMRSFLARNGLGLPDVCVGSREELTPYCGNKRSFSFIEMFPFVNSTWKNIDYGCMPDEHWAEALGPESKVVYQGIPGCDYFVALNGPINKGVAIQDAVPYECDWDLPMFVSVKQRAYRERAATEYGDYALFNFGFRGTYVYWTKHFGADRLAQYINRFADETGMTPILTGGTWNADDPGMVHILRNTKCVDLVGRTTLEELFGLIKGAGFVFGYPSGLTMLSPALGAKTLALWSDLYPEATSWNVVPPRTWNRTYFVQDARGCTVDNLMERTTGILKG